jgi:hypothetical protein
MSKFTQKLLNSFRYIRSRLSNKSTGVYISANEKAVILYCRGQSISMNPKLADELAKVLPLYAQTSRKLAAKVQKGEPV